MATGRQSISHDARADDKPQCQVHNMAHVPEMCTRIPCIISDVYRCRGAAKMSLSTSTKYKTCLKYWVQKSRPKMHKAPVWKSPIGDIADDKRCTALSEKSSTLSYLTFSPSFTARARRSAKISFSASRFDCDNCVSYRAWCCTRIHGQMTRYSALER